jgi:hypothetical protein
MPFVRLAISIEILTTIKILTLAIEGCFPMTQVTKASGLTFPRSVHFLTVPIYFDSLIHEHLSSIITQCEILASPSGHSRIDIEALRDEAKQLAKVADAMLKEYDKKMAKQLNAKNPN